MLSNKYTLLRVLFLSVTWIFIHGDESATMEFKITKTWDGQHVDHTPVNLTLIPSDGEIVLLNITAPFFNDSLIPDGPPGEPFNKLWDYEVVEAFFLGQDSKYLELEFSPHGQHLVLLLSGRANAIKICLPLMYSSEINGAYWKGTARIPISYFPQNVSLFNAYAIHGSGDDRVYEALYPVPAGQFGSANFHRLEYFKPIDFSKIDATNNAGTYSDVWKKALENAGQPLVC